MQDPTYSVKEIMELQFKGIDSKLDDIRHTLKDQNVQTEKRFAIIEKELDEIRTKQELQSIENARYKTLWGIGATIGASLVAVVSSQLMNK
jgi:hypothetical protein